MKLKDKVAIVTGAARGIGQAIALRLAKEGAKVVVVDRNEGDTLEKIKKDGGEALFIKADLTSKDNIKKMVAATLDKYVTIDILVNNACLSVAKPITEATEEDWHIVNDMGLKGTWMVTQAVVPTMIKNKSGKIVNTGSLAGIRAFANQSIYCAVKGGVVNMTRELAIELAPYNINVNVINPGVIDTPLFIDQGNPLKGEFLEGVLKGIPLGRVGKPDDIAGVAAFLASSDADYMTGALLSVDGGWSAK
ncbi:MAG: 3-oxoacyl-ACP reductase FabG [Actinobacteria bacterium]|nr:3-oxoacyl-ACP reductase FabG [Actinomycetota bacterium]